MARYSATLNRYVEGETVTPVSSVARTTSRWTIAGTTPSFTFSVTGYSK